MAVVKILVRIIVLLVAVFLLGAFLLPREVRVERSTTVNAPAAEIFPYVNSMQETGKWSPWLELDPDVALSYSGPEAGVGNRMEWRSDHPQVGSGSQEIIDSEPDRRVVTALDFGEMGTAQAHVLLAPHDSGTEVTWGFVTDTGRNPLLRWMGLMMDGWVGSDYEKGLARLKTLAES
ncbi:MAG: hypothetical protein EP318_13940 [Rhodobacteraceae bacterium]|nr:MAG: hypothetical protein EP318_13940 [Paracoccaceae bacterium]